MNSNNAIQRIARIFDAAALVILLAIVAARPLISETYDSAGLALTQSLEGIKDASPTTTACIDLTILIAGALWLVSRRLTRDRTYHKTGLEVGIAIIAAAAMASCFFAGAKRVAINSTADYIATFLLCLLLSQLLNCAWRRHLAVCVLIASAITQAGWCLEQVYWSFPETLEQYKAQREVIWSNQNIALDSPQVALYEARLKAREASGFLAHSNIAAAHLLLGLFALLAIARSQWTSTSRAAAIAILLLAFVVGWALWLTGSLGCLVAAIIGLAIWIARLHWTQLASPSGAQLWRRGWIMVAIGIVGVVCFGYLTDSLPSRSLTFRWQYWSNSAGMIADHPVVGVGKENFGRHYLQYKTIESPEEVKNPHNVFVAATSELGVIGLIGTLLLLIFGSRRLLCGKQANMPSDNAATFFARQSILAMGAVVAVLCFAPRVMILGSNDSYYIFWATAAPMVLWVVGFCVSAMARCATSTAVRRGLCIGLLVFLLQDMVNFAVATPGTLTIALAAFAIALRMGDTSEPSATIQHSGVVAMTYGIMFFGFIAMVCVPVWQSNAAIHSARHARDAATAMAYYDEAAEADPYDGTASIEKARLLRKVALRGSDDKAALQSAIVAAKEARRRDPFNLGHVDEQLRCGVLLARLVVEDESVHVWKENVNLAGALTELHPSEPTQWIKLGDCLMGLASALEATGNPNSAADSRRAAVQHFEHALTLDAARPESESFRRLPAGIRVRIDSVIRNENSIDP